MAVVTALIIVALLAGIVAGLLAWKLPNFDPAAPTLHASTLRHEVEAHPRAAGFLQARVDPTIGTGLALTVALAIVVAGAVGVGVMFIMFHTHQGLARFDVSAARWGSRNATADSTRFLMNFTDLGSTLVVVVVAVAAGVIEFARTRTWAVFAFLLVVVGGELVLNGLVKDLVQRARPDIDPLAGFSGTSFPSGHSAAAAATYAGVALLFGRGRSPATKALLAAGAAAIAAGVAASRVLLGVHWLTDVIAGLALGWAWFALSSIAFGGRVLRFGRPVEAVERMAETVD